MCLLLVRHDNHVVLGMVEYVLMRVIRWSTYDAVEIHKLYPAVHEVIKMANDPHLCQLQHVHFWKVKYILMVLPLTF